MNRYFEKFSVINYNNSAAINITQRATILNKVFGDRYAFYPYQVKNGMRARMVAEKYYGDPDFEWLVYFSNNIVDPYHEWPMDDDTFMNHIVATYGSLEAARNTIVAYRVNWYEDTRQISKSQYDNLQPYEKKYWTPNFDSNYLPITYSRKQLDYTAVAQDGDGVITSPIPNEESAYWSSVSAYDIEEEENARKSNIRLLDNRLAQTASSNLRDLLLEE